MNSKYLCTPSGFFSFSTKRVCAAAQICSVPWLNKPHSLASRGLSDGSEVRPTLTQVNDDGLFNSSCFLPRDYRFNPVLKVINTFFFAVFLPFFFSYVQIPRCRRQHY